MQYTLITLGCPLVAFAGYHGATWGMRHGWGTAVAMAWALLAIVAAVLIRREVVRRRRM